jgi:hypothetical protein
MWHILVDYEHYALYPGIPSLSCTLYCSYLWKYLTHKEINLGSHHDDLPSFHLSGKSTVACALSRELQYRGHLTYVLDGDNLRHGLNRDLTFKAEDRAENIRRVGKLWINNKKFTTGGFTKIEYSLQEKWQSFSQMLVLYASPAWYLHIGKTVMHAVLYFRILNLLK